MRKSPTTPATMAQRRRRTDALPLAADLPGEPDERVRAACAALHLSGFADALAFDVPVDGSAPRLCARAGEGGVSVDVAAIVAEGSAHGGRPMALVDGARLASAPDHQIAAVVAADGVSHRTMIVVSDPHLSRREAEAVASWLSPDALLHRAAPGACSELASELTAAYAADVAVIALFAESGMLLNLHVRSGGLLRSWRLPVDTVWGEAARHEAAFMLGELHLHPGAESLASLGMHNAAIVGITNGQGVAVGAVGVASRTQLDMDVPRVLLGQAAALGARVMHLRGATEMPVADAEGMVELRSFAAKVGCRRFALYSVHGRALRLASAHAEDGSILVAPPDPYEEQLVCWAAEKGIAVVSEDAAAVMVGDDTVLYAQDPSKRPIDCLRRALVDLRSSSYGANGEERAA